MTQLRRPSTANVGQARAMGARLSPLTRVSTARITAAMATRPSAKVSGGKSSSPTLAKKNEPPHKSESTTRRNQSAVDIDNFAAIDGPRKLTSSRGKRHKMGWNWPRGSHQTIHEIVV